jgi:hypothetical protein
MMFRAGGVSQDYVGSMVIVVRLALMVDLVMAPLAAMALTTLVWGRATVVSLTTIQTMGLQARMMAMQPMHRQLL